jgi:protein ImuB
VRICALSLPELRVEVVRASDEAQALPGPLAIVVAPPPMTEQKLLGNTRIDVVSKEARALGVRPGQTIAQARARASSLAVRVARPESVRDVLAGLAEVALAFGATVSFAMESDEVDSQGDVVWVDVTGCSHLHAPDPLEGETLLAARLAGAIQSLGHVCSAAVADGPRVAAILARAAAASRNGKRVEKNLDEVIVVPPGRNAVAIEPLPIHMLPMSTEDVRWLTKVGVRTIGELRALPRAGLATRLGARAQAILSITDGDDRAPLAPYVPPEIPEEEARFEYGVESTEGLLFVGKSLTDRLAARLAGRAVAAAKLELELILDAALLDDRSKNVDIITADLPAPLSTAGDLLAASKTKIERLVLRAPVLAAKLRAPVLVPKPQAALSLFEPQPKAERALPRLVAELSSDLGPDAVGTLVLGDSWVPEDRSRFVRLDGVKAAKPSAKRKRRHLVSSVPEPTRILAEPEPVTRDEVRVVRHLSRIEAVEWWRKLPGTRSGSVDFVFAWADDAPAWVEIDRLTGHMHIRGWFD